MNCIFVCALLLLVSGPIGAAAQTSIPADCPYALNAYRINFKGVARAVLGFNQKCTLLAIEFNRNRYVLPVKRNKRGWTAIENDSRWEFNKKGTHVRFASSGYTTGSTLKLIGKIPDFEFE